MEHEQICVGQLEEVFNQLFLESISFLNNWISPIGIIYTIGIITIGALLIVRNRLKY